MEEKTFIIYVLFEMTQLNTCHHNTLNGARIKLIFFQGKQTYLSAYKQYLTLCTNVFYTAYKWSLKTGSHQV